MRVKIINKQFKKSRVAAALKMKTIAELKEIAQKVIEMVSSTPSNIDKEYGRPYLFMLRHEAEKLLDSGDCGVCICMLSNYVKTGELLHEPDQYPLFPMDKSFGNIENVMVEVRGRYDFRMALGLLYSYDLSQYIHWDSVIALPRELAKDLHYRVVGRGYLQVKNPEVLEQFGIKFPEPFENYKEPIVHIDNIYIAEIESQLEVMEIPRIGWWSSDFSGYGSLIRSPFQVIIDKDFIYKNIREIGYTAEDVLEWKAAQHHSWEGIFQKKFLEERIIPFFTENKIGVQIAEGSYSGRPLGIKRGAENSQQIFPKTVEDLKVFAGLGNFIQCWLSE